MAKRTPKPNRGVQKMMVRDPNSLNSRKVQAAITELDLIVSDYENRWGVDRLPSLVDEKLRERFEAQLDRLNSAIDMDIGSEVRTEAETTARAYAQLEKVAKANGHKELTGEFWEAAMPDGRVLAVTRNFDEQHKVARENRDVIVYCLEEVANIIASWETNNTVTMAKHVFPGAVITDVKDNQEEMFNDQIPF